MRATSDLLSRSVLVLALVTLLIGGAAAQTLTVEDDDKVIWNTSDSNAERTLNAGLTCDSGNATITVKRGSTVVVEGDTTGLSYNFEPSDVQQLGEYTVMGNCSSSTSTVSENFYIAEMTPEIASPEYNQIVYRRYFMGVQDEHSELYKGNPVELDMSIEGLENFGDEGWRELDIKDSEMDFSIVIPEYSSQPREMAPADFGRNFEDQMTDQVIELHPRIPSDIDRGHKSLQASLDYDGDYGSLSATAETGEEAIYLTGMRTVSMQEEDVTTVPERQITKSNIGGIRLQVFVESGFRKYLSAERFDLRIERDHVEGEFELSRVEDESGLYTLELTKEPEDLPDSDKFDIGIVYDDPLYEKNSRIEIASYTVFSDSALVQFEGRVADSDGRAVSTVFRSDGRVFETNANGFFSQRFVPGDYDFNISFTEDGSAALDLNEVGMRSQYQPSNSQIGYEYVNSPSGVSVPGIKPMDLVAFRFLKPYEKEGSSVTINYDVSGSSMDPREVSVLACDSWDGGWEAQASEGCASRWEKVTDTTFQAAGGWSVTVPVKPYEAPELQQERILRAAYVIGTRSGLRLNGPLTVKGATTGRAVAGSELTFQGQFVSAGAAQIDNANVTVSLLEGETAVESFEGQTGSDGSFSISGEVPEEPGNYTIRLEAEKEPYDDYSARKQDVWVYREEELALTKKTEDRWELQPGEQTRKTLVVENTGQETLQDITLEITGTQSFNRNYVSLATSDIGTLQPGDTREVDLVFDIPDSCPTTGCSEFSSSVDLEVSGDGVSATLDVGPQIMTSSGSTGTDTETRDSEQRNETGDGVGLSDIPGARATGQFLAAQSTLNIALGLMLMFLMVLAGALKSKNDGDAVRRNVVRNSGGGSGRSSSRPGVQPPRVSPAHDDSSEPLDSPKSVAGSSSETEEDEDEQEAEEEPSGEESGGHGKVDKLANRLSGSSESGGEEPSSETDESGEDPGSSVECGVCGEEFDTQAGVELHKKTAH